MYCRSTLTARTRTSLLLLLVADIGAAHASHFRYGHITYAPQGPKVVFRVQAGWRLDANHCLDRHAGTQVDCAGATPRVGETILDTTSDSATTRFALGDGTMLTAPLAYAVTSIDRSDNWLFGLAIDPTQLPSIVTDIRHTYPGTGTFTASFDGCCRLGDDGHSAHANNPDIPYHLRATVVPGNASPLSALPPIIACPLDGTCRFPIPAADPDGDPVSVRLAEASDAEAGSGFLQPAKTFAAHITAAGEYEWDTAGVEVTAGKNTLYSTQVILEDHGSDGAVKSRVPIDFMIRVARQTTSPPTFEGPCNQAEPLVTVGHLPLHVRIAAHNDNNRHVTLNAVGLPPAARLTEGLPVGSTGGSAETTLEWKPLDNESETFVATFVASNDDGATSFCVVKLVHAQCTDAASCDDGLDCTDDECKADGCHWTPIPERCRPLNDCTTSVCAPDEPHDARGCVAHELPSPACCTNCIDDDGDGTYDIEDQDCCGGERSSLAKQSGPRIRHKRSGTADVRLHVNMTERTLDTDFARPDDPPRLVLTDGGRLLLCGELPAAGWKHSRLGWRFRDPTKAAAGGVRRIALHDLRRMQRVKFALRARCASAVGGAGKSIGLAFGTLDRCTILAPPGAGR